MQELTRTDVKTPTTLKDLVTLYRHTHIYLIEFNNNTYFDLNNICDNLGSSVVKIVKSKWFKEYSIASSEIFSIKDIVITKRGHKGGTIVHVSILNEVLRRLLSANEYLWLSTTGQLSLDTNLAIPKHVYCFLFNDNSIKIGISSNINRRKSELENQSGKYIVSEFYTEPIEKAYDIEQKTLLNFYEKRVKGEWIVGAQYEDVIEYVKLSYSFFNNETSIKDCQLVAA